jgi:localization factor PodJL
LSLLRKALASPGKALENPWKDRVRPQPNTHSEQADEAAGDPLASVHQRLDGLTERLDRIARATLGEPLAPKPAEFNDMPDPVAEALARLDRRLDEMMAMSHAAAAHIRRPIAPSPPKNTRAYWAEQIAARQRALEEQASADNSGAEQQRKTAAALSHDLSEIGRALTQATPQCEIEALQAEVRSLSQRIDNSREAGAGTPDFSAIERELSQIRGVLGGLTPAESLAELETVVHDISIKVDRLSRPEETPEDPAVIGQLETAIASLRSATATAASEATLAQLTLEVRGLATQFERITAEASTATLNRLESRIRELLSNERSQTNDDPPDNAPAPVNSPDSNDRLALHAIDNRMALLTEKLELADDRLGRLASIERGLADVLVHLKDIGVGAPHTAGIAASQPQAASSSLSGKPNSSHDPALTTTKTVPQGISRQPIDPTLPPDTPLEPGSSIA